MRINPGWWSGVFGSRALNLANVMVKPPREFDIFLKESAFGTYLMWKSMKNCIEVINWLLAHSFTINDYGT